VNDLESKLASNNNKKQAPINKNLVKLLNLILEKEKTARQDTKMFNNESKLKKLSHLAD
jgi:hypothetical protein